MLPSPFQLIRRRLTSKIAVTNVYGIVVFETFGLIRVEAVEIRVVRRLRIVVFSGLRIIGICIVGYEWKLLHATPTSSAFYSIASLPLLFYHAKYSVSVFDRKSFTGKFETSLIWTFRMTSHHHPDDIPPSSG